MSVPEPSTRSLAVRHLLAYPLAGCGAAVWIFAGVVRPSLSWDAWLLDAITVACGACGLLGGGMYGFAPRRARTMWWPANAYTRALVPVVGAVLAIVVLTGLPAHAFGIAGTVAALAVGWVLLATARRRQQPGRVEGRHCRPTGRGLMP